MNTDNRRDSRQPNFDQRRDNRQSGEQGRSDNRNFRQDRPTGAPRRHESTIYNSDNRFERKEVNGNNAETQQREESRFAQRKPFTVTKGSKKF